MPENNKRSARARPEPSRRQLLRSISAGGTTLLAGCGGVLGGSNPVAQRDPNTPPDADIRFNQSKGIYERLSNERQWRSISVEIVHEGGDPIETDTLSVTVNETPVEEHDIYQWDSFLDGKDNLEKFEDGIFEEDDGVAVRGVDDGFPNDIGPHDGDMIRLHWNAPEEDKTRVLGSYEVKACLGDNTPDPQTELCPGSTV